MVDEHTDAPPPTAVVTEDSSQSVDGSYWHLPRMIIVWAVTAIAAAAVVFWVRDGLLFEWLLFVLAGATLLTFGLQLGTAQKRGFIDRTALSVAGACVVVALFSALGALVA